MNKREINQKLIVNYKNHLIDEEKSLATITKYIRDIEKFYQYADKKEVTKELVKLYKEELMKSYKPTSINSMLAALNQFFEYNGWLECKIKELKIQKRVFLEESKELSKDEYKRLVNAARKQKTSVYMFYCKQFAQLEYVLANIDTLQSKHLRMGMRKYIIKEK